MIPHMVSSESEDILGSDKFDMGLDLEMGESLLIPEFDISNLNYSELPNPKPVEKKRVNNRPNSKKSSRKPPLKRINHRKRKQIESSESETETASSDSSSNEMVKKPDAKNRNRISDTDGESSSSIRHNISHSKIDELNTNGNSDSETASDL